MKPALLLLEDCYALGLICWWWAWRGIERRFGAVFHLRKRASQVPDSTAPTKTIASI